MATETSSYSGSTTVRRRRRYWRRSASPRPWWPWGITPLLGLVILFLFGALFVAPRIEADVREQVVTRYDAAGFSQASVRADGQHVMIEAEARPDDSMYLDALARSTRCDTWVGELTCPSRVTVRPIEPEARPATLTMRPHAFTAERSGNQVLLTGEVPDLAERDRIVGVARQHFGDVADSLTISDDAAGANYSRAADQALAVVSRLTSGRASWSGEVLTVEGVADASQAGQAREQFGAIGDATLQGKFDVRVVHSPEQCNSEFRRLLGETSIRFRTGSAVIDAGNDALLAGLADVARNCPGTLTIEGHTDSQGEAEMNEALSLARATAVRDELSARGISVDRLHATGYGETRPIDSNDTAAGRARNRRIEIIVDSTEH